MPQQMTIVDGPMTGSRMDLGDLTEITIGRAPDCDFLVSDDFASGRHARLIKRDSVWFVEDLDSRNGTFVHGEKIEGPVRVTSGSDIKIGRTTVRLVA
jgi:FHA domain protein